MASPSSHRLLAVAASLAMGLLSSSPAQARDGEQGAQTQPRPPASSPTPSEAPAGVDAPEKPDPVPDFTPPRPATEKVWYGWQTILADGASLGLGIASRQFPVYVIGYLAVPPIIHWSHGHLGKGFASLGLRVGAPVILGGVGALIGLATAPSCGKNDDFCLGPLAGVAVGGAIGTMVGVATAATIDATVLARETVPREPAKDQAAVSFHPTFHVTRTGASGGLGGVF